MATGEGYSAYHSLFRSDAALALSRILPVGTPSYTYPRMDDGGVTFFRNYPASAGRAPYSHSLRLTFEQLADVIDTESACYRALTT